MYALSCHQEELADVIYAFASLLRNNISQDKMTTLKEELAFCEKYIYLYQMRYPDSFAYHVKIDESIADLAIPKFVIQPLVENYFVHGIDYSRHDNALSIKALDETDHLLIQVLDNGRGISQERLTDMEKDFKSNKQQAIAQLGCKMFTSVSFIIFEIGSLGPWRKHQKVVLSFKLGLERMFNV